MVKYDDSYFAQLERELGPLSAEDRESIVRELRSHTEDAFADRGPDAEAALLLGLPMTATRIGRTLRNIHAAAQREARKRRSLLLVCTAIVLTALIVSFIWPWLQSEGRVIAFLLGGVAVVCSVVALIGLWVPKPRLGRWLIWSGGAGLTLVGVPPIFSVGSFYLLCGSLLVVTGTRLHRA